MNSSRKILEKTVGNALSGKGSHAATKDIFGGLTWKVSGVRPKGASHSIYQLLNHMSFWQEWLVKWLDGENPPVPKHAAGGWPGEVAPAGSREWQRAVRSYRSGLEKLDRQSREADLLAKRGKHTRLGLLHAVASHNSYHAGQVALLRQMLGAWPPPSGGVTW